MVTAMPYPDMDRCVLLHPFRARTRTHTLQVSLEGARYAMAWSGGGCGSGFDLVWASGRTWSFLCEDSFSANSWVREEGELSSIETAKRGGSCFYPLLLAPGWFDGIVALQQFWRHSRSSGDIVQRMECFRQRLEFARLSLNVGKKGLSLKRRGALKTNPSFSLSPSGVSINTGSDLGANVLRAVSSKVHHFGPESAKDRQPQIQPKARFNSA